MARAGQRNRSTLKRYLPILEWGSAYDRDTLANDLLAAVIVTIMLIPQSLAYALLAGLPAGTVSGAPKIRAMQIINEMESHRRGIYGGAVGYFGWNGDMDENKVWSMSKEVWLREGITSANK